MTGRFSKWAVLAMAALSCAVPALWQTTAPSAHIAADNRVTFRLYAPEATDVRLDGNWPQGGDVAMTKDDAGVWSVTVGPLKSEFWLYRFMVGGVPTVDPRNNSVMRDGQVLQNALLVPGAESALYQIRDVPHATVSGVWYDSPTLKIGRRMQVYSPPGYEASRRRYRVLYLLHGGA